MRARLPYGDTTRLVRARPSSTTPATPACSAGSLQGAAVPVGIATVVGLADRAALLRRRTRRCRRRAGSPAACCSAARVGNLVDRLRLGYVTDFIARNDRNAFNLADLAIYAGLGLMLVFLLTADRSAREPARL